jgi:hypothetical protein
MRRPQCLGLGQGLDQGREIGARVCEQVFDAAIGENFQIGVSDGAVLDGLSGHLIFSLKRTRP